MVDESVIIEKVRSILNEIGSDETLPIISEDTLSIDEYIKSVIPDAVTAVSEGGLLPVNPKTAEIESVTSDNDGVCVIDVPSDFLRLISIKLEPWRMSVSIAYKEGSEEHKRQSNPFTRSGISSPCAIITDKPNRKLMLYSSYPDEETKVDTFAYDAMYDGTLSIEQTDKQFLAVCYMCAYLVYTIFENNSAERLLNIAKEYMK